MGLQWVMHVKLRCVHCTAEHRSPFFCHAFYENPQKGRLRSVVLLLCAPLKQMMGACTPCVVSSRMVLVSALLMSFEGCTRSMQHPGAHAPGCADGARLLNRTLRHQLSRSGGMRCCALHWSAVGLLLHMRHCLHTVQWQEAFGVLRASIVCS